MRKIIMITCFLLSSIGFAFTQHQDSEPLLGNEEPLSKADIFPKFTGGVDSMYKFIYKNLQYPAAANDSSIQGTIITQFVVDVDSTLKRVRIVRGIGGGCNEEVMRLIQIMSEGKLWEPGSHEGRIVPVTYTIPIKFVLKDKPQDPKKD